MDSSVKDLGASKKSNETDMEIPHNVSTIKDVSVNDFTIE